MANIRIHLSELRDLDPTDKRLKTKKIILPKPQRQLPGEESLLEAGLDLYSKLDQPHSQYIGACLDFERDPSSTVSTVGTMKHIKVPTSVGACVATGPAGSAGAGALLGVSAGVFFSTDSPGIGLYGSIDVGILIGVSAQAMWQFTCFTRPAHLVFNGPPVVLIGVNVSSPGIKIVGGGFIACFLRTPGPLEIIGAGFQLGVGVGLLPVEIFMSRSFGKSTI